MRYPDAILLYLLVIATALPCNAQKVPDRKSLSKFYGGSQNHANPTVLDTKPVIEMSPDSKDSAKAADPAGTDTVAGLRESKAKTGGAKASEVSRKHASIRKIGKTNVPLKNSGVSDKLQKGDQNITRPAGNTTNRRRP